MSIGKKQKNQLDVTRLMLKRVIQLSLFNRRIQFHPNSGAIKMASRELQVPSRFAKFVADGHNFDGISESALVDFFNQNRPEGAELITSSGQLPRLMKEMGWRFAAKAAEPKPTESGESSPKPSKKNGKSHIPSRVVGWLEARTDIEIGADFSLEEFWGIEEIATDSIWWNRSVSRLGAEEIAALRAWAGRPLTAAMADEEAIAAAKAAKAAAANRIAAIKAELASLYEAYPEFAE